MTALAIAIAGYTRRLAPAAAIPPVPDVWRARSAGGHRPRGVPVPDYPVLTFVGARQSSAVMRPDIRGLSRSSVQERRASVHGLVGARAATPAAVGSPSASALPTESTRARSTLLGVALGATTGLVLVLGAPSLARAYRTFANDPLVAVPARWDRGVHAITWEVDAASFPPSVDAERVVAAVALASLVWDRAGCAAPVSSAMLVDISAVAGDGRNTITVVADDWTGRGFPAHHGAFTDVRIERAADGSSARIVEADIYLNSVEFQLTLDDAGGEALDLQAVLTHEIGHGYGLLHPCETDGAGGAPLCSDDADFVESVVYPNYVDGAGRMLSADDVAGLCSVYAGGCPETCDEGFECRNGECEPDCGGATCGAGECSPDVPCASGACGLIGDALGRCVRPGDTGAPCVHADDCASSLCVQSRRHPSYCTIPCSDDSACSGPQACQAVDEQDVCAPLPARSGCSVARHRPATAVVAPLFGALGVLMFRFARRRR